MLNKKHTNNIPQDLSPDPVNDLFAHVGAQLPENFPNDTPCWIMPQCIYQFKFSHVQSVIISSSQSQKQSRCTCITHGCKLLRLDADVATPVLCNIVCQSIKEVRDHDDFKLAKITHFYKYKGSHLEFSHYRLYSHVAKMLEGWCRYNSNRGRVV